MVLLAVSSTSVFVRARLCLCLFCWRLWRGTLALHGLVLFAFGALRGSAASLLCRSGLSLDVAFEFESCLDLEVVSDRVRSVEVYGLAKSF